MKKEMIKAIRMVYGVNPDLRKRLAGINKECLMNWIDENKIGIFGISVKSLAASSSSGRLK